MQPPNEKSGSEIAIVGMAGRFPGASDVDLLWENLCKGVESVAELSLERWGEAVGAHPAFLDRPELVKARPRIEGVELFDAAFFGYTPREAQILDPQQRLFLECAWEALENAGYDSERFPGSIGVCAGISQSTYLINYLQWDRELNQTMGSLKIALGNMNDALATRVAYKLNLRGAAYAVQSFCSTSLVAVHLGCQSLLNRESDVVLAGGVTIALSQDVGYQYQEGGILSPDGHTRTFDAKGQGMVFGNGLGIVVLKRLRDALRDGDNVRAVILGSAINNDGSFKVGFTAPSVAGQAEVVVEALAAADVDPETIGYVEAHGTATALGDPAEIAGLTRAWRRWTEKRGFCAIGSIKSNIGHLDAAAGVAGLIKTVLCLENRRIPKSLHFEVSNPQIDFASSPFFVATDLMEWRSENGPRRAGVSSFGIGGTNAHAILEEAPALASTDPARPWQLLVLSAKTETALESAARRLAAHLAARADANLADVAWTLQVGRRVFNHRRAAVVQDLAEAVAALADPSRLESGVGDRQGAPVAFLFTGQGSQYVGMGRGLYESEPVFREAVDRSAEALRGPLGLDLRKVLYPKEGDGEAAGERLRQTALTQPALFVVEHALARLWMSWGIEPKSMLGHSVGEYVAACLAGVFSLEDALALVAERGRLMQSMPPGAMLAVPLSEATLRPHLGSDLDLASLNTPSACVVAGPEAAVTRLERDLGARGVVARRLHTSHAFHSGMMEPIIPAFVERVAATERRPPAIPFVSNVTGTWITAGEATDPAYWGRHLRCAVRFSEGVEQLRAEGNPILLEVGPGNTLAALARQHAAGGGPPVVAASLRHPKEERDDRAFLLGALGRLWMAGVAIDWARVHAGERRRRVVLPAYPFERQRYWVEPDEEGRQAGEIARGYSLRRRPVQDWFYQMSWRRFRPAGPQCPPSFPEGARWLVFLDETGLGTRLVEELRSAGQPVVTVRAGTAFDGHGAAGFAIHPGERGDYLALLKALGERGEAPTHVVHLWGVTAEEAGGGLEERLADGQARGFYSLLYLAQALGRAEVKHRVQIAVLTNQMQEVMGGELQRPDKATVLGPCKVIPQELENVRCVSIDLELGGPLPLAAIVRQVLTELANGPGDPIVAYRGRHRWVQSAEPMPLLPPEGPLPLREGGVYLITGGMGGIGYALAHHLAGRYRAKLVLTGRTAAPRTEGLRELEALGGEALYVAADVASREDMERVVGEARRRFGRIHAVVHAAGVAGGGLAHLKEPEAAERVLAPKLRGTLVLSAALAGEPLDFFVLCSSTAALLGGFGQIDYCAANCFLDAFAHHARAAGAPVLSINWDAWKEVGMAVNTPVSGTLALVRDWSLKLGIAPEEGVEAFARALTAGLPQVAVFTMDLLPMLLKQRLRPAEKPDGQKPAAETASPASVLAAVEAGGAGDVERAVIEAWEKVLGRDGIGVDDNFFELGGDSLSALQVTARLKARLGREVPIVLFYEAPTVALLARALGQEESAEAPTALEGVGERAETRRDLMRKRRQRVQPALDGSR